MSEKVFNKVLAANRGEIAVRIFRACYDLGIHTVAMYSKEDELSMFRTRADEAYLVGENKSPLGAYLDIPEIIDLAKRRGVDAIHPGYGFLSENADFARACEAAGITFIGPPSDVLGKMGDKLSAKQIAMECGVPVIPGCSEPLRDGQEALEKAISFGFPVILKAAAGGGGRGMRLCEMPEDVIPAFELVKSEARKAFGNDDIFIEKYLVQPKHIEVQILADQYGNVRHLGERDCSLQRRYQKVVEFAPAWSVPESIREQLHADAVKIAEAVGYVNAGTVEFLVDRDGNHYFIEMNPRIQVEHTVTEMVTSIDLVRAQILIAEGQPISHPEIGLGDQNNLKVNGYAIQCRVTTEDPANNFAPDNGKIEAYRSGGGFGVRLDGGNVGTGSIISPYYDSLLVKVTSWDCTFPAVCRKATRAINEEHVRGVKTNIPFVTNILTHPTFVAGKCHTKFIDETPELFEFTESRDRATRVLKYIANIQVNNPDAERHQYDTPRFPKAQREVTKQDGLKLLLDTDGPEAVKEWVLGQKKLLITDTTMRDAHQSLLSTRLRTRDMVKGADGTADILADCFSLEMWGGAHMLAIKDMSGLLKPYAAKKLVSTLKQEIGIPIHLHTHNTTDNQIATYLMAAEAGVDVVDTAIGPLANLTSQPSMNALVESLRGQERDTGFDPQRLQELADYWADVRLRYESFDKGLKVPVTDIYRYEIPGGQYTNLQPQVESLGLGHRFAEVKEMYRTVNLMLGDIIKVTPSSKMVGDLAIFMVQNDLTPENIVEKGEHLAFPDSVVSYFKGMMGQPPCGFPKDLQRVVLKGEKPITGRPGDLLPPVDWDQLRSEIRKFYPNYEEPRSLISFAMYPKVYEEYIRHRKEYGYIMRMGSHVFFNGMAIGEMNKINIEDGKTLMIKYIGLGDRNDDGTRNVQFELNGMRREVSVPDPTATDSAKTVVMADPNDKSQAGASIPGMVSKVNVKPGDQVKVNDVLAVIEAMKMETSVVARMDGTVDEVFVKGGQSVKAGELLLTIK